MEKYILDGMNMMNREAAFNEIQRVLPLPAHFGRNLDALWDELSVFEGEICVLHAKSLQNNDYGAKIWRTLTEATETNPGLRLQTK